jgi:hypothetical protein
MTVQQVNSDSTAWLARHRSDGTSPEAALAFYDSLAAVPIDALRGRWRGSGLPTGHPWDGLLEATGWYGKEFVDPETVHPLLFRGRRGRIVSVHPRFTPVRLLARLPMRPPIPPLVPALMRTVFATRRPTARLREVRHRGVVTATMIYDHLPIQDVFRRVDDDVVLGFMDLRGLQRPFFFVLERVRP